MSTTENRIAGDQGDGAPSDGERPLLELRNITKTFGPVRALTSVSLDIPAAKVTALIGDNGAGKSSLIKTISGLWAPDGGELLWEGRPVRLHGPKDAEALRITTIYQDLALCDNLDIVQNMFLGHEPLRYAVLDEPKMELIARQTLQELRVTTVRSVRQPVASLSGGQRQSVAVAKAVMSEAKLVIMDEPTAALGVAQTSMVLNLIKTLSSRGVAVLVISHNLVDVFEVADRIAVLYLGRLVTSGPASEFNRQTAVEYMTTGTAGDAHAGQASASSASSVSQEGR
jgi:ABC-type sugar transport system ATPase subunit